MALFYMQKNKSDSVPLSELEFKKAISAFNTHKWDHQYCYNDYDYKKCSICGISGKILYHPEILLINDEVCYDTCDDIITKEIIL